MKYALGVLLALLVLGALVWWYIDSQPSGSDRQTAGLSENVSFKVLDSGMTAFEEPKRKNYAIYTVAAFSDFWKETHDDEPMPLVDFSKYYVIAVFAGTVPSEGYAIAVSRIRDDGDTRTVTVAITEPGELCPVVQEPTNPYQFVQVPFSEAMAFAHTDVRTTTDCR